MLNLTDEELYYLFEGGIKPIINNKKDDNPKLLIHSVKHVFNFKIIDGEVRMWKEMKKFYYEYLYQMADEIRTMDNHRQILKHGDNYSIVMC